MCALCFDPGVWGSFSGTEEDSGTHQTCFLSSVLPQIIFQYVTLCSWARISRTGIRSADHILLTSPTCPKFGKFMDLTWRLIGVPSEKAMAPHSSTLAWKIPWTEEPGRLQSKGSLRVRHDKVTSYFHFPLSCIGEGNGNPLQCSCLENPRDGGAWWAAVYGVAQSRTQLKRLSSSNISQFLASNN